MVVGAKYSATSSPLYAGIEARHVKRTVRTLILKFKFPHCCRIGLLSDFHHPRKVAAQVCRGCFIDEDVRVLQHLRRSTPVRIRRLVRPGATCCHVIFVHVENGGSTVARGLSTRIAYVAAIVEHAVVAIVEDSQLEIAGQVWAENICVMLRIEPVRRRIRLQREIPLVTEFPQYVARTTSVPIVNLQDPMLMAQGKQETAVVRDIKQGIGMGPIRKVDGMAIHIEMIESIPHPDRVVVSVKVDDGIALYCSLPWISRQVGEDSGVRGYEKQMSIGKKQDIMIDRC